MSAQGFGVFFDAQILAKGGLTELFGDSAQFANSTALVPGDVLIASRQFFATPFKPASVIVTVEYRDGEGAVHTAVKALTVQSDRKDAPYAPPIQGWWMVSGFPNLNSHHRFIPSNEFALDFSNAAGWRP